MSPTVITSTTPTARACGHRGGHELGGRLDPGPLGHRVQVGVRVEHRAGERLGRRRRRVVLTVTHSRRSAFAQRERCASSSSTMDGSSLVNTGVGASIGRPTGSGTDAHVAWVW